MDMDQSWRVMEVVELKRVRTVQVLSDIKLLTFKGINIF